MSKPIIIKRNRLVTCSVFISEKSNKKTFVLQLSRFYNKSWENKNINIPEENLDQVLEVITEAKKASTSIIDGGKKAEVNYINTIPLANCINCKA